MPLVSDPTLEFCASMRTIQSRGANMTKEQINAILDDVRSWPEEDQEELVELAREIQSRRTGVYVLNDEERAAVLEGLNQANRGEFVPYEEMDSLWKKYGLPSNCVSRMG